MLPTKGGSRVPFNEIVFAVALFVLGVFTICGVVNPPTREFANFWSRLFLIVVTVLVWSVGLALIVN